MILDSIKVKKLLIKKCWSLKHLAETANISSSTLNKSLNKNGKINLVTLGKITKALEVEVDDIVIY